MSTAPRCPECGLPTHLTGGGAYCSVACLNAALRRRAVSDSTAGRRARGFAARGPLRPVDEPLARYPPCSDPECPCQPHPRRLATDDPAPFTRRRLEDLALPIALNEPERNLKRMALPAFSPRGWTLYPQVRLYNPHVQRGLHMISDFIVARVSTSYPLDRPIAPYDMAIIEADGRQHVPERDAPRDWYALAHYGLRTRRLSSPALCSRDALHHFRTFFGWWMAERRRGLAALYGDREIKQFVLEQHVRKRLHEQRRTAAEDRARLVIAQRRTALRTLAERALAAFPDRHLVNERAAAALAARTALGRACTAINLRRRVLRHDNALAAFPDRHLVNERAAAALAARTALGRACTILERRLAALTLWRERRIRATRLEAEAVYSHRRYLALLAHLKDPACISIIPLATRTPSPDRPDGRYLDQPLDLTLKNRRAYWRPTPAYKKGVVIQPSTAEARDLARRRRSAQEAARRARERLDDPTRPTASLSPKAACLLSDPLEHLPRLAIEPFGSDHGADTLLERSAFAADWHARHSRRCADPVQERNLAIRTMLEGLRNELTSAQFDRQVLARYDAAKAAFLYTAASAALTNEERAEADRQLAVWKRSVEQD